MEALFPGTEAQFAQIAKVLRAAKKISVVAHIKPDADAVGSACGLTAGLRSPGIDAHVFIGQTYPHPENLLTVPGMGREVGSYAASYRPFYQGLYMAPHTTAQALKGAALFARVFEMLGMETMPSSNAKRSDIVQAVRFEEADGLISFCRSIQSASPVDSAAVP